MDQKSLLSYLRSTYKQNGRIPQYREIQTAYGIPSLYSVTRLMQDLMRLGYLSKVGRHVEPGPKFFATPSLGYVSAGDPRDVFTHRTEMSFDELIVRHPKETYTLQVRGDSMIGRGIQDGDTVVVDQHIQPKHGDIIVGEIDGEMTLKTYITDGSGAYLHPENPAYKDIRPSQSLESRGVVTFVLRRMR